ncbi:LacI family DNA-binding transcriptional regulator [Nocardiopsis xinjiangensis]|uniref:LacI family DNA-binding transcriptional regulator n=1 Tax=Nocardiopsis xinjiangensis TaxID=124285 RepID=UPI000349E79B|nr:LacI family DNA-binding transcriptional regulator [Nocardiopsis xinjiangensis]
MVTKSEDVARAAGVSRATVSQILNGHGRRFSKATRERVLQAAEELAYRPSVAGRALATGTSDIVVALLPYTTLSMNLQQVLERTTEELAKHGITLVLRLSTRAVAPLERLVTTLRPRAMLSLTPFGDDERALLERHSTAVVSPADYDDGFDQRVGRAQAEHLIERGFRRLAFVHIDDERYDPFGHLREVGVREVCQENGLPEPVVLKPRLAHADVLDVVDALEPGTGAACYNDDIAVALMHAAAERRREVPDAIAIIGMDGTQLSEAVGLTTLSVDVDAAARASLDSLLAGLGLSTEGPARPPVEPHVVARRTT